MKPLALAHKSMTLVQSVISAPTLRHPSLPSTLSPSPRHTHTQSQSQSLVTLTLTHALPPRHLSPPPPARRPTHPATMVKVEIVDEQDTQANSPYASHASSRTGSSVSLSSVASDLNAEESFYERLSALVDIVPPTTRHSISNKISATASFVKSTGKLVGTLVWVVTTSALLVGLPLAMSLEDEAKVVAQEQEMLAQQRGAQQVCPFVYTCTLASSCHITICHVRMTLFSLITALLRLCLFTFRNSQISPAQMMQPSMYGAPPGSESSPKNLVPPGF